MTARTPQKPAKFILYFILLLTLAVSATLLSACSAAPQNTSSEVAPPAAAPQGGRGDMGEEAGAGSTSDAGERIVIQNATVSIIVPDPEASLERISALAVEMDGFVVSANLYQTTLDSGVEVPMASITIRVDSTRLDEALNRIEAESDRPPQRRNVESQDVTAEYTDLQSRLRNLQNTEAQLTEIMDEANDTEEVLSVYNELSRVRGEIEVTQGRIQYYEQAAKLSSIEVSLTADDAVQPLTIGGWEPGPVARDALQALIGAMKFLGNAAIWIVIFFLPVLLVLYFVFFLPLRYIFRRLRGRRAARATVPPPPVDEPGEKEQP